MGIFHSPMKLVGLASSSASIAKQLTEHDSKWYFSQEGEKTYKAADTLAKKTMYLFNYLLSVSKSSQKRDIIYKLAYVMAGSMDSSSLDFAGYPNIIDPDKNPLVDYLKAHELITDSDTAYGLIFLSTLHGEEDPQKYIDKKATPYLRLTYCDENGSVSDMYKIERYILGVFCSGYDGKFMPPYLYDIVESAVNDSNED